MIIALFAVIAPLFALVIVQNRKKAELPAQPVARQVSIETDPPGATVSITLCDAKTGEPMTVNQLVESAPATLSLFPGRYLLHAVRQGPAGLERLQAHRTVPELMGEWPSMSASWERSRLTDTGEVKWPTIKLPTTKMNFEMAYVPGADKFVVQSPTGPRTVFVAPFYVATREFTFGDFQKIRPDRVGNVPGRSALLQPPHETMPTHYDWAEHWAEECGARLLTDLEFAYLASLANQMQSERKSSADESDRFTEAGGSTLDEIPLEPPVRGILTGYAEWTSTWAHSPLATVNVLEGVDRVQPPSQFRIIRGGTVNCRADDYPRLPTSASAGQIHHYYSNVGFRLALTPLPDTDAESN